MSHKKVLKRFAAVLVTLALVVITNVAISNAAASGASNLSGTARGFDVTLQAGSNQLPGDIPR
ncbi:MAG: hypothetical protein ACE5H0_04390 [Bacteroidota bacterium]